jgi:hypothetical protein
MAVRRVRGGNAYLLLLRSKQPWGLSTPFGWRLTSLKMTELNIELAPHFPLKMTDN